MNIVDLSPCHSHLDNKTISRDSLPHVVMYSIISLFTHDWTKFLKSVSEHLCQLKLLGFSAGGVCPL